MTAFSNTSVSLATEQDIPAIHDLLNSAYRGERSRKGWTTEADLIAGDQRTTESQLMEVMKLADSNFLIYRDDQKNVCGCVNLQLHVNRIYLGMFSVKPELQGKGIGKILLRAAEEYTMQAGFTTIYMSVISLRSELISWYQRCGYTDTGERKPFHEDSITGRHLQPLEFLFLEKHISVM